MLGRSLVVLVATLVTARAQPAPMDPPLTCPNDAESCELVLVGKLVYSERDKFEKWDNLRFWSTIGGKARLVYASINIPHRTRLKLQINKSYRFTVAGDKPFGPHNVWVIDAKPL